MRRHHPRPVLCHVALPLAGHRTRSTLVRAAGHDDLDRRNGRRRNQAPIPAQLVLGTRLGIRAHRGARHPDWGDVPYPRSRPARALGRSRACRGTTVTDFLTMLTSMRLLPVVTSVRPSAAAAVAEALQQA